MAGRYLGVNDFATDTCFLENNFYICLPIDKSQKVFAF